MPRNLRRLAALPVILLILAGCAPNDTPPSVDCAPLALADPVSGWRFQTDRADSGRGDEWFAPGFDDSGWRTDIAPGQPWEQQGLDYDGIGWFRARVSLPEQTPLLMAISGVDDAALAWIDGQEIGALANEMKLFELDRWAGKTVTLAIRVADSGGYGGIKDPVRVGGSVEEVLTRPQWAAWLADQHPEWPLPAWTHGGPAAWTMTGGIDAADESLVSREGLVAPWASAPTAAAWLVGGNSSQPVPAGDPPTFSLVNDHLPIPRWEQTDGGAKVSSTLFHDETDGALRWMVSVDNTTTNTPYRLLIAVTPFAANQAAHPITAISAANPARVWVNGQPYLVATTASRAAGVGRLADMLGGPLPSTRTLGCIPEGDGAAILEYFIPTGQTQSFELAFPARPGEDFPPAADASARLDEATKRWEERTGRVGISLPDGRVQGAFRASTGYLLLALDPAARGTTGAGSNSVTSAMDPASRGKTGVDSNSVTSEMDPAGPRPGPLAHDSVWVRDATTIGLALLQTGHADSVKAYLPTLWAGQSADGRVPPITGKSIPWDDDEWDAQGEAIFLTTSTARYTGDTELLKQYYPQIKKSAEFIRALRARNTSGGPAKGLLPPSLSAEDLGPEAAHYYWDDFWAVAGLEEASSAAQAVGESGDSAWMSAEADDLRAAILASVRAVMGPDPAYIPGSVEETESSSAARGSVPALWPVEVLAPDDPLVTRSFDFYHTQWIEPFGGAFMHRDAQFWPVGGLELAHAYLALGRGDVLHQVLGWTLSHQTLPGTYAWADEVSPDSGGMTGGDMPHAWVAASYVTLIREMLIREQGDSIRLFTLAPEGWFGAGNVISVGGAPTWYGPLTLSTESTIEAQDDRWAGTLTLTISGAAPPGGFTWQVPREPSSVEGPEGTVYEDGLLTIPPGGGVVTLGFGE